MEINGFIKKFTLQFEESEMLEVKPETNFRELSTWDSLTAMCVQTMILDDYDIKLTDQEFKSLKTVQEIIDFIENHKK